MTILLTKLNSFLLMVKIVKLSYQNQTTKYTYHDDWGDNSFYKYVVLGKDRSISTLTYLPEI